LFIASLLTPSYILDGAATVGDLENPGSKQRVRISVSALGKLRVLASVPKILRGSHLLCNGGLHIPAACPSRRAELKLWKAFDPAASGCKVSFSVS
jgi:hypothetical protein